MVYFRLLTRPFFAIALVLLLGVLIGGLVLNQVSHLQRERAWLTHTYIVIDNIDELLLKLTEAESSQRRYMLSRDEDSLAPFHAVVGDVRPENAADSIDAHLQELRTLLADNPRQIARIERLATLVHAKVSFMQEIVAFAPGRSLDEIKQHAKGRGVELMSEVQSITRDMENEERQLLQIRTEAEEKVSQRIIGTCIGSSAFLIAVLLVALATIQRELGRRYNAEKALRETMAFQTALLQNSPYAIIAVDTKGAIKLFNPAAEAMLLYSSEEMVGKTPAEFHDHDEVAIRAMQLSEELGKVVQPNYEVFVVKTEIYGPEQREWTYIRKDGRRLPVQLIVTTVRDQNGEVIGYFGIAEDITERKNIERMKNEFISTVSHELRTPLTSIRGSLSLVLANVAGPLEEKAHDLLSIAYNNSERLVRLINDILDIEKIESGSFVCDLRPVMVGPLLQQAVEENQPYADKFSVKLDIENKAGKVFINANQDHLLQVFANLLSNAIKFSNPDSVVKLSADLIDDRVRFRVTDKGLGIPVEFQERIFGKFSQADSSSIRAKGGTGLGLSISKALVEKMQGAIGFFSVPGETVFHVDLPVARLPAASLPESKDASAPGAKKRVLIVEDDPDIASLLRLTLAQEGLGCAVAYSARQAKKFLETEEFVAMTLDLELPDQDGLLLMKDLRAHPRTADLPIIVISIRADEGQRLLAGQAVGVVDWLQKPIDIERLQRIVRDLAGAARIPSVIHVEDDTDVTKVISVSLAGKAVVTHATTMAMAREELGVRSFDLAILDITMPDGNGLDLIPALTDRTPPIPIIILSASETPKEIQRSVQGSLVKSVVSEQKIVNVIQNAIKVGGERWKH